MVYSLFRWIQEMESAELIVRKSMDSCVAGAMAHLQVFNWLRLCSQMTASHHDRLPVLVVNEIQSSARVRGVDWNKVSFGGIGVQVGFD